MEEDGDVAVLSSSKVEEEEKGKKEENILMFLDGLDGYLTLLDSLTSTLRKGWLDLASARHSMGSSRISSSLFDLKEKSAATTLQVFESAKESPDLHYKLSKWASLRDSVEAVGELQKSSTSQLRHRGASHIPEGPHESSQASATDTFQSAADNNQIQMERSKSLAVFGTLVSPKLRSAQVSFETALDTIVDIANMRASILSAFAQLQKEKICQTEVQDDHPGGDQNYQQDGPCASGRTHTDAVLR